jgi:cytochrome c oxidase cbb3-type subunit I/II
MEGRYDAGDRVVTWWFFASIVWFAFFTTFGFIMAIKFFQPYFLGNYEWLTFGRVRPAHVNGVLFGFVSSGLIGGMFYILPRLVDRQLYSPLLGKISVILWNGAVLVGILLILAGNTQGREYAELPWIIDLGVMITLAMMGINVFATLIKRNEAKLYVSTWYFVGTFLWFPVVYFIGNVMWRPFDGALYGIQDAIFNWYYGHNVLGLWFTTLGIPIWYYAIPKMIKRPLYSHLLSLIAFFTIAFFYTGVGAHHLLQAPIPEWIKTIGVVMSILMLIPVLTFATNILLTMRGSWSRVIYNIPLRFIVAGFILYVLASFQGPLQSFRTTNMYLHFSQWTVGHAHLALLGGFGFLAVGTIYWLLPHITGKRIYSTKLMALSWWLAILGFINFFLAMTLAGLVANASWWQHLDVATTLPQLEPYFIFRAMGGGIVVVAAYIFAFTVLLTFLSKKPREEDEFSEAEIPESKKPHSKLMRRSQEGLSLPVIAFGGMAVFTIMTYMVVAMPYMYTTVNPSDIAHAYTPLEQEGRLLYKSMGCFYCHSQFTRSQDWALGNTSQQGDFYYDSPHFLGTERTGPNLATIGGKRPTKWHYVHDRDAREVSPNSIMPPFEFLSNDELRGLVMYVQNVGGENLETQRFQPFVPEEYASKTNPYMPLMMEASNYYDPDNQTFFGSESLVHEFADRFEEGKVMFVVKCLACHGCSGNGQGPYARNVVTRPANLHERLRNYPEPDAPFHFWRVSEGVPGTAMPIWKQSLSETDIWKINLYETSFIDGAIRAISGDVSDEEAIIFSLNSGITPPIGGTQEEYTKGMELYELYCAQCHGVNGQGDGPASVTSPEGYISPEPANFTETGADFEHYGQYVWKVKEGVATTNMPPWKYALSDDELYQIIFYIQSFASKEDYNTKWGPIYQGIFARTRKEGE